jgi:hypothetical protein
MKYVRLLFLSALSISYLQAEPVDEELPADPYIVEPVIPEQSRPMLIQEAPPMIQLEWRSFLDQETGLWIRGDEDHE